MPIIAPCDLYGEEWILGELKPADDRLAARIYFPEGIHITDQQLMRYGIDGLTAEEIKSRFGSPNHKPRMFVPANNRGGIRSR